MKLNLTGEHLAHIEKFVINFDIFEEIKYPFAHLTKGDASVVWFELLEGIVSFNDIPENYPRWVFASHSKKEANDRITEMVKNEGWELVETKSDELILNEVGQKEDG